jgi:Uma2 family endonuclease
MATSALIPVEEYLRTSYRPDCDYIDGEVRERNLGERPHSLLQGIFFRVFDDRFELWGLLPLLEQRVQVSATRFRVPDLCLVRPSDGSGSIVSAPPVLCVEILSREDSFSEMEERAEDYFAMGVTSVWIIDPVRRKAIQQSPNVSVRGEEELSVPGTAVRVSLVEAFKRLDYLLGRSS